MTYPFPPPVWFETGTTSRTVLLVALWCMVWGMPVSVAACWIWKPRSRLLWTLSLVFWATTLLMSLVLLFRTSELFPVGDSPEVASWEVFLAFVSLVLLPFPAFIAGCEELLRIRQNSKGFHDLPTWGCSVPVVLFLVFMSLPGLGHPREASWRSQCKNNLKAIALALHNYADEQEPWRMNKLTRFPDTIFQTDGSPLRSWRVELLPFLDGSPHLNGYDSTKPWDSTANLQFAKQRVQSFVCPSVPERVQRDSSGHWFTAYATLTGPNTVFPNGQAIPFKDVTDGLSNTSVVVEACGQQIVWTEPRDIVVTDQNTAINLPGTRPHQSPAAWSSYHRRVVHTLLGDGSVRSLNPDTDPQVLRAITTAHGGEDVEVP